MTRPPASDPNLEATRTRGSTLTPLRPTEPGKIEPTVPPRHRITLGSGMKKGEVGRVHTHDAVGGEITCMARSEDDDIAYMRASLEAGGETAGGRTPARQLPGAPRLGRKRGAGEAPPRPKSDRTRGASSA